MTYEDALNYIHSFKKFPQEPSLSRISMLLERLDNPQQKLKFIHVAGTNGKGSAVTVCSDILSEAGYKCGKFTSPFILDFRERFQINNNLISKNDFANLVFKISAHISELEKENIFLTEFEVITAIAFLYFLQENCDIVVLEVGLGGQFDATNVIPTPLVSAIMSISLDHTEILGDSVAKIAKEKAGIIKDSSTVICYPKQDVDAVAVLMEKSAQTNANFILPSLSTLKVKEQTELYSTFSYDDELYTLSLPGEHQIYNAITVLNIVKILREKGFSIEKGHIKKAFYNVSFLVRSEVVSRNPLIIIDGAHNFDGITSLVNTIKGLNHARLTVIIGMLSDKDYINSLELIASISDQIICVDVNSPRALPCEKLCEEAKRFCENSSFIKDPTEALDFATNGMGESDLLVCCGSLYMVCDIRKNFK